MAQSIATIKLEAGPAKAVIAIPVRGAMRIIYGFVGTGLAHPKPVNNSKRLPNMSR
jgi:hypothetical protein